MAEAKSKTTKAKSARAASEPEVKEAVKTPKVKVEPKEAVKAEATAKAGKRSQKAIREESEKQAKEERKTQASDDNLESKPKAVLKARSRIERRGKNYRKSYEQLESNKEYILNEALKLAKTTSSVKFDATVEMHINLGVDPKHADQNVRDNLMLPAGTGKSVKIAVLSDDPAAAKKTGADLTNSEEIMTNLDKGVINFDILVATPSFMPKLGKYARILGPRGLMPNPKSGTVTNDIDKSVAEARAGKVEYRVDATGIVHVGMGKVSFSETQLFDNAQALLTSIKNNKPASVKGNYLKTIYVSTSMGPSIKVSLASVS
jgi:large subunit ribosomal protein L1